MKKFKHILLSILFCLCLFPSSIYGQTSIQVTYPYGSNPQTVPEKWKVYYTDNVTGNQIIDLYGQIHIGSKAVHCVEPNVSALNGASDYQAMSMESIYSPSLCQEAGWIYALGIQKDPSNEMDLACQILLWKLLDQSVSNFTYHSDIQAKMDQVNQNIQIMKTPVCFETNDVLLDGYGKENSITLLDSSNVFEHYIEKENNGIHYLKEGNSLTVWLEPGDNPEGSLSFDCFYSSDEALSSTVYISNTSQNVLSLEKSIPNNVKINVSIATGKAQIHKVDESGNYIPGTSLKIVDESGNTVDKWISENQSYVVSNLLKNQTYTLIEEQAAEGYICSDPISFTIENIDSLKQIHLINHQIFVYKSDQFKNPVRDVHLQVLNSDGEVIDEWITGKKIVDLSKKETERLKNKESFDNFIVTEEGILYKIDGITYHIDEYGYETIHPISNLKWNQTYTLHEEQALPSYIKCEDIQFIADKSQCITMVNLKTKDIDIKKTDENNQPVKGATLSILDKDGNEIETWISDTDPHTIKNLILNEEYTLCELKAPDGYQKAEDIHFTVNEDTDEIIMKDQKIIVPLTGFDLHTGFYIAISSVSFLLIVLFIRKIRRI